MLMYYTFCSHCGKDMGRSGEGTMTEVRCPKCGVYLSYVVKDGKVTIEFTEERKDVKHIKYYGKQVGQAGQ